MKGGNNMEIRHLTVAELELAIQLSDKTFRNELQVSMWKAFPLVFSSNSNLAFGAFDKEKLVCFFGLVPFRLKIGPAYVDAFSIGSVCTDPEYRGKGIASKILAKINDFTKDVGASLLLVSGDRGLYTRNGCLPVGKSYTYHITNHGATTKNEGNIRRGTNADLMRVYALSQQTYVRYESSINEWKTLLDAGGYASIFNLRQSFFVSELNGEITGYVVVGLPDKSDLKQPSIITEWGGDSKSIFSIIMGILEEKEVGALKIKVPWHDALTETLVDYLVEEGSIGGTVRVIHPERLVEQIMPYLASKDPAIRSKLKVQWNKDGTVVLKYDGESWLLPEAEFSNMLFNPIDNLLPTLFPIPLPSTEGMYYV